MIGWFAVFLINLAMNVVAYLLTPKPKSPKPEAAKQSESPTAEAGIPVPVIFGEITLKGPNCLWFGDQMHIQYQVKA
jgi:hypothetical protein